LYQLIEVAVLCHLLVIMNPSGFSFTVFEHGAPPSAHRI
jgi:hypothetical protein